MNISSSAGLFFQVFKFHCAGAKFIIIIKISAEVKVTSFIIKGDILSIIHFSIDIVKKDICLSGFWEFFRGKSHTEPSSCMDIFISLLCVPLYI